MAAGAVKRGARASWHAERGQLGHRQHRRKARPPRKRLDDRSGQPLCRPREPEVGPGQRCAARRRERRDEDSPHGQSDPWHNQRHGGRRCGVDPASGSSLAGDGKHTPPEQREQTRGCSQTSGSGPLLAEWWAHSLQRAGHAGIPSARWWRGGGDVEVCGVLHPQGRGHRPNHGATKRSGTGRAPTRRRCTRRCWRSCCQRCGIALSSTPTTGSRPTMAD